MDFESLADCRVPSHDIIRHSYIGICEPITDAIFDIDWLNGIEVDVRRVSVKSVGKRQRSATLENIWSILHPRYHGLHHMLMKRLFGVQ